MALTLAPPARRRPPRPLVIASAVIAVALLLPIVFLLLQAADAGWHDVFRLLFRRLTRVLLVNTVELAFLVSAFSAVLGTGAAFLLERTQLPGRRAWAVLVVLPVAIPDFVVGYSWHSMAPAVQGLGGATLVMTLALYPLVYIPVAAALRRADHSEEEVARSLGLGPLSTFLRVTLRQIRPALTGGCLVVCLALLAEYGAFEIVRFHTFTTTIFSELGIGDLAAASGLSIVLVLIGMAVLGGEASVSTRGRISRAGGQAAHIRVRRRLPAGPLVAALAAMAALVGTGVGVPVGTLAYWMHASHATTLPGASLWGALVHTASYSTVAALVSTAAALPVALLAVRFRSPAAMALERSTFLVQSLPGLVIALALVYFANQVHHFYQTSSLLVAAYAILFFPLALICVRASVAQAPRRLEEVARSLGEPPRSVFLRVTLPLVAPGLAAGFCLVFLTAATELTATLLLVPPGVHTLATQFWAYQRDQSFGAAAPYAVVLVALAAVPSYALTRWFDRHPGEAPGMTALELSGVHQRYARQPVLDGVELRIERGSFTAVLGASGSGKTTLLRVIAGFERIESGAIRLGATVFDDGRTSLPPERRKIGYVPQDGALFPHLRVGANVAFGLRRSARHQVGDLLEAVGLTGLERRYPHELSGGQQQRVALARALAIEPEVVLLDEPFSALDAAMRASVRREVADLLRRRGTTTVLVTHDQDEALSMADRVAVLRGGRIVTDSRPEELYRSPLDADLAGFLGEANLLDGVVQGGVAGTALGRLVLQDKVVAAWPARRTEAVVLVRPEQLEVRTRTDVAAGGGILARVVDRAYFGHDAVLRVVPAVLADKDPLLVRITGHSAPAPGMEILITVRGPVMAWPAESPPAPDPDAGEPAFPAA